MKKLLTILAVGVLCTSCVASNPYRGVADESGKLAGLFNGIWDGTISPIVFVISLFNEDVSVYNPNSSNWYAFGFMLGCGALGGGASSTAKR